MEINKIPKEIIDKIPSNLLYSTKARKQIRQFHKELGKLINEKTKLIKLYNKENAFVKCVTIIKDKLKSHLNKEKNKEENPIPHPNVNPNNNFLNLKIIQIWDFTLFFSINSK